MDVSNSLPRQRTPSHISEAVAGIHRNGGSLAPPRGNPKGILSGKSAFFALGGASIVHKFHKDGKTCVKGPISLENPRECSWSHRRDFPPIGGSFSDQSRTFSTRVMNPKTAADPESRENGVSNGGKVPSLHKLRAK